MRFTERDFLIYKKTQTCFMIERTSFNQPETLYKPTKTLLEKFRPKIKKFFLNVMRMKNDNSTNSWIKCKWSSESCNNFRAILI